VDPGAVSDIGEKCKSAQNICCRTNDKSPKQGRDVNKRVILKCNIRNNNVGTFVSFYIEVFKCFCAACVRLFFCTNRS
jgi:hypothetical protein